MKFNFKTVNQVNSIYIFLFNLLIVALLSSCGEDTATKNDGDVSSGDLISNENSSKTTGPVKLAAFIQKSGSDELAVKSFQEGMQLVLDSGPSKFEVAYFNVAEGNSDKASRLKSFVEKGNSPVVLYWNVDDIISVAPYLTQSNAVGLVSYEVTKKIVPLGANVYGFGFSSELTFRQFAKFAGNTLKSYRIGVIKSLEPQFDVQSKTFIEESKSLGNTIVFDESIDSSNKDFSALVMQAQKENCDTIFAVLPAPSLLELIKAIRTLSFKGKVLVGDTLYSSDLATLGKDADGIYLIQAWTDDAAFKSQYLAKYGISPDGITLGLAALGYDTAKCLQGVGASFDASSIKYSFLTQSCEGLTGKTQFTGERMAQRKKQILTVSNGHLEQVG